MIVNKTIIYADVSGQKLANGGLLEEFGPATTKLL